MNNSISQRPGLFPNLKTILLIEFLFLSIFVVAEESKETPISESAPETLKTKFEDLNGFIALIRSGFERAVNEADEKKTEELNKLNQNYLRQLEQIQRFYNDSGNAAAALRTRDEINQVREGKELTQSEDGKFEQLNQKRSRYAEVRAKIENNYSAEMTRLIGVGNKALEKRSTELTRKGDLDRVEALTKVIPNWTGRPDIVRTEQQALKTETEVTDGDFLAGKKVTYPHNTKPEETVSMIFRGKGNATYVGLGGIEKPWSYKKGSAPDEYLFWMTGRPQTEKWVLTLKVEPGGRTGIVSDAIGDYRVEAKIRN